LRHSVKTNTDVLLTIKVMTGGMHFELRAII